MTNILPILMLSLSFATNEEIPTGRLTRMPELLESVQADYPLEAKAAG